MSPMIAKDIKKKYRTEHQTPLNYSESDVLKVKIPVEEDGKLVERTVILDPDAGLNRK